MRDQSNERKKESHVQNADYEKDIKYVLQVCQRFLSPIGIWPLVYNYPTKRQRILSPFLIIITTITLCFVTIPLGHYIFIQEKNLTMKLKLSAGFIYCVSNCVQYTFLGLKRSSLGHCIRQIQNDWKNLQDQADRDIMMVNVTIGRGLTTIYMAFLYSGSFFYYAILPLLSSIKINETLTIRILAYPGNDVFLDTQRSPIYEILYCSQCFAGLLMFIISVADCSLATTFVIHACGQVQVHSARLKNLMDSQSKIKEKRSVHSLNQIIANHVQTLRFSKDVDKVLREICFSEIVAATLIICMVEYYCMMEWNNNNAVGTSTYLLIIISYSMKVLIYCYVGEFLDEQCRKVGIASYEVEWYNLPRRKALHLILMIAISNYPPNLTAGKIFKLSLATFGSIIQTSFAYLNLLRSIMEW